MLLSEFADRHSLQVERDGEFQNLGFLTDQYDGMLVFLEDASFADALERKSNVGAVITTAALGGRVSAPVALATCDSPRLAFARLHNRLATEGFYWRSFPTEIDAGAEVHSTAWVAAQNVRIGSGSVVGPHATIQERCVIGENVRIGAGAVLGAVGFQTVRAARPMLEMTHAGGLAVEDRAEILPGAVVATGLFRGESRIGPDARVGAQAFISHAVVVGPRAFVGHGAIVNGNVAIGEQAWVGPGAVISNNLSLGDECCVSIGAVVTRDVAAATRVSGNFATRHARLLRQIAEAESDGQDE